MLLIGYGNAGRGDDGLGPAFAERIAARQLEGIEVDVDYQLTVDHALAIAGVDRVVFADAMMDGEAPFQFYALEPGRVEGMGSHSLTPPAVLSLTKTLYGKTPEAFVLGIAGHDYGEVKEGLSADALRHLDAAEAFFLQWLENPGAALRAHGVMREQV